MDIGPGQAIAIALLAFITLLAILSLWVAPQIDEFFDRHD